LLFLFSHLLLASPMSFFTQGSNVVSRRLLLELFNRWQLAIFWLVWKFVRHWLLFLFFCFSFFLMRCLHPQHLFSPEAPESTVSVDFFKLSEVDCCFLFSPQLLLACTPNIFFHCKLLCSLPQGSRVVGQHQHLSHSSTVSFNIKKIVRGWLLFLFSHSLHPNVFFPPGWKNQKLIVASLFSHVLLSP